MSKISKKKLFFLIFSTIIICVILAFSMQELLHKNEGKSTFKGQVNNGTIENSYLFPYRGPNFKYFSFISYYLMDNAYIHSKVYDTVIDAYKILEKEEPDSKFQIMECSDKYGGKLKLHRTHKNGKSIDFMVPKKGKGFHYNNLGLLHYLLEFDENGILSLNKSVEIDFEVMAKHILTLQKAGKNHGVTIKKVILKINLKDDLWETPTGKKLKTSGIYFAQSLSKNIDDMHDDHYHIDFALSN